MNRSLALNGTTTLRWTLEEDVAYCQRERWPGIGVLREKVDDLGEAQSIALLSGSGLKVSSLSWAGGFTGSDGREYAESMEDARRAIGLADEIGAWCLVVHSGGRSSFTRNHARRLLHCALDDLLPVAERFGVTLAVEPMSAHYAMPWTILDDPSETKSLFERYRSSRFGMVFDVHYLCRDPRWITKLHEFAPYISLVQLSDSRAFGFQPEENRCVPGQGYLGVQRAVQAILREGYRGPFEVELFGVDKENFTYEEILDESGRTVRAWLGSPDNYASSNTAEASDDTSSSVPSRKQ